jgi:hypothetical protein
MHLLMNRGIHSSIMPISARKTLGAWELEERLFLMIVRPLMTKVGVKARTTFLAPRFEVET